MTNPTYTRHRLSALCGDMDAESFKALVEDIRNQGQLEPIDLVGSEIVDGWHRYRACRRLELELETRVLPEGLDLVEVRAGKERASSAHDGGAARGGRAACHGMDAASSARSQRKG